MDPITQGVVGAAAAQTKGATNTLAKGGIIGALAGMAPDLDALLRSSHDPLFFLEFHRQFSHSLLFIPFGACLCAGLFYLLFGKRWQLSFKHIYLWSLLGYATHGLLDTFTSYGTQLLWPITDQRFSWDSISIIDPLFTLPLLVLVALTAYRKNRRYLYYALSWAVLYLTIGFIQHERALEIGSELAKQRNHQPLRIQAKPSFANLAVWKVIYETEQYFYVAAIKPGLFDTRVWPGEHIAKLNIAKDFPWLDSDSQQARDIARFSRFSDGFLSVDPSNNLNIVDVRYSLLPQQIKPLWGITLSETADANQHARYFTRREQASESIDRLIDMIIE